MMKKVLILFLVVLSLLFCSCDSNVFTLCVESSATNKYEISFGTFKGTKSKNIHNQLSKDGAIFYTASLEEGAMDVYYKINGKEELLFTIEGNQSVSQQGGYITGNANVIIIMKTKEPCKNGKSSFKLVE